MIAASILAAPPATAEGLPILVDGYYDDWTVAPLHVDPAGDTGSSGIDFRNLWVAEDDDWLFIRFDTTVEIPLAETTNIALYLDTDANSGTGVQVGGLGAELRWRFGLRSGTFYVIPPWNIGWNDILLRVAPSVTSTQFEIAIGRAVEPDGSTPLFTGDHIRVLLRDEDGTGDRIPDDGEFVDYFFTNDGPGFGPPNSMNKDDDSHVRLVTMNVHFDSPWDSGQDPRYNRLFSAMNPDIINFQEIFTHTAGQTRLLVEEWLPPGPGEQWYAFKNADTVTLSKWPFVGLWSIGDNFAGLVDTDAELGRQLLIVNTHLPCCEDDAGRQAEADAVMSFIRDAITPGGSVNVPDGTGIVLTGDMNLIGSSRPLTTLLTGDIADEGTWGADFDPDWDGTALADAVSPQTEVRMPYTWRNDSSNLYPSRIDMVLYTDSVLGMGNHFTLYTPNMSPEQLDEHALLADDSPLASDHIPHVTDFYNGTAVGVSEATPLDRGRISVAPNPMFGAVIFSIPLEDGAGVSVEIYDVTGRLVRDLGSTHAAAEGGRVHVAWDGITDGGAPAPSGIYFVRVRDVATGGGALDRRARVTLVR